MNSQIAAITENDRIGVLAVAVITNSALAVLLLAHVRLAINRRRRARAGPVRLRGLRIRLGYPLLERMPLLLNLGDRDLKNLARYRVQVVRLALRIQFLQPHVVLLVHVVLDTSHVAGRILHSSLTVELAHTPLLDLLIQVRVAGLNQPALRPDEVVALLVAHVRHGLVDISRLAKRFALKQRNPIGPAVRRHLQVQALFGGLAVDG